MHGFGPSFFIVLFLSSAAFAQERVQDVGKLRLDLAAPEVPAFTALDVSPSKVSRPTTIKDLAAALSSGIGADGRIHNGLALEIAPLDFLITDSASNYVYQESKDSKAVPKLLERSALKTPPLSTSLLRSIRISVGSNVAGETTQKSTQIAIALRAGVGYNADLDADYAYCLASFLSPPPRREGAAPPPPGPKVGSEKKTPGIDFCRDAFLAAHTAVTAVEGAVAVIWAGPPGDDHIYRLQWSQGTTWLSLSYGFNSTSVADVNKTVDDLTKPGTLFDDKALREARQKLSFLGFEPILFTKIDLNAAASGSSDHQITGRIVGRFPLKAKEWSIFLETGVEWKLESAAKTRSYPLALGGAISASVTARG